MSVLRSLFIKLGLKVDAASFAEGEAAAHYLEKAIDGVVGAGVEFLHGLKEQIAGVVEYGDKLNKASQASGIARGTLQELQYAAQLADVSNQEFSSSINILTRTMRAARDGAGAQGEAFSKLGIKTTDSAGKLRGADEVISDIADKLAKMPDGAEKTALAMQFFGRSGARMIPILNEGSAGLRELRQEARDMGLVLGDESVKASEDLNDNLERLRMVTVGLWRQAIGPLIPAFNHLIERFLKWRRQRAEDTMAKLKTVTQALEKAINFLGETFDLLTKNTHSIAIAAGTLGAAFLLLEIRAVGAAVASAAAWVAAAAPFVAIAAILAGMLLILDDIRVYKSGKGRSLFGIWANTFAEWQKPSANDPWWLKSIKELVIYLEKALDIYNKMNHIFGPDENTPSRSAFRSPKASSTGASVPSFTGSQNFEVPKPYIGSTTKNGEPGTFLYGYRQARAAGLGIFESAITRNAEFASPPSLPPGGGVLRAPVQQVNQRTYNIYQSPGMSPQDVYNLIQSHEDSANEAAAAALGP